MAKRTYRYFSGDPLYPFGYGLSYSRFEYGNAQISAESISADDALTVSADVINRGAMASDEVVQLYLTHAGLVGAALRELHGFQRVQLAPGEHQTVSFTLRDRDLSVVDADGRRQIATGKVQVWIGGGQPSSGVNALPGVGAGFTITSSKALPN